MNNYVNDQCVYIYPGAASRTILTRNAEAIREAAQRWRAAKSREEYERKNTKTIILPGGARMEMF